MQQSVTSTSFAFASSMLSAEDISTLDSLTAGISGYIAQYSTATQQSTTPQSTLNIMTTQQSILHSQPIPASTTARENYAQLMLLILNA